MLISVGRQVSERLVGAAPDALHQSYADPIFVKLLCHAISLHKLSPASDLMEGQLWDMPSACAVARCIIEAHDVLEYIALANLPEEERSFRLVVWRLHDQQRRSSVLKAINSTLPQAQQIHSRAAELQTEAEQHSWFNNINREQQRRIRNGDAPSFLISHRDLNAVNGVDHDYHVAATMMLSQYVHTLPMAVHQLQEFRAGTPEGLHLSSMPIQYSLPFLARAITRMAEVFPRGNVEVTAEQESVFLRWRAIAENGVTLASYIEDSDVG
ncbi:hypothetical protein [Aquipseudomonas alcaligenes]|uniref:hypothetical protein n=1 Tax=Aquipseudomonas alcaligenes TaxID=43263 RepID=UPI00117B5BB2|nr:hypothetical protein [Pseudomonas alcaligenes]